MEDYFISWNRRVLLRVDLFLYQKTFIATCLCLEDEKSGGLGGALGLASSFGLDLGGGGEVSLPDLI
jgi:hypothetical protein